MLEKFDGEGKVYYSEESERKVEELIRRRVVQQKMHAFQIGAAIGILTNSRKALEGTPVNFGNVYSLDNGNILESVLLTRHAEATTGKDRLELLQQYAEAGIDVLYQEVILHRAVDWEGLIARIRDWDPGSSGQTPSSPV